MLTLAPRSCTAFALATLLSSLLAPAESRAVTITAALKEGDLVTGVGNVTRIDNLAINDSGDWLVEADTDFANTDQDQVLVRNGALHLREDQALTDPAGASINTFDAINLNANGDSGWNFFLSGTSGGSDDSGIYFNDQLVIQESDISTAAGFSAGTPYIGFFEARIFPTVSERILVVASVDDPNIASSVDRALVIVEHDGSGALVSETVVWKEGDVLSGQVDAIADFGTGPHQFAVSDAGDVLFFADLEGLTTTDGVVYVNDTLLAQEGSPSPIVPRLYEFLSSRGNDLSNTGHHVFKANLDGNTADDEILVVNGEVFRQEGDTLPDIAPFQLTSFGTGSGPVQISDAGHVLWFGDWSDPDTDVDTGLFLNDVLIVQEGVTQVGGVTIDTIASGQDAFALSDNGLWAIFEATLVGGIEGAFLLDLSDVVAAPEPLAAAPGSGFRASPNPFLERTELRFSSPAATPVTIRIFDVSGRLVRSYPNLSAAPGEGSLTWDGRDLSGRRVPAGVYFARMETAGGASRTEKLTFLAGR